MINLFSLVLLIITMVSGIFWCINKMYSAFLYYSIQDKLCLSKKIENIFRFFKKRQFLIILDYILHIYKFISSAFPILLLVFVIRSFFFEPFQIPSGSMMPTLLIGDFILVKKFSYGIKNPVTQNTWINTGSPKRGDVIVFKYPKDPKLYYIKRVIGKPKDKIIYNVITKQLTIYPNHISNDSIKPLSVVYKNIVLSDFVQKFHTSENGTVDTTFSVFDAQVNNDSSRGIRLIQTTESLDGVSYNILTMIPPGDPYFTKIYDKHTAHLVSEWYVPEGKYFVMGDNRDNSSDSRYWGFVPEENVVGKAMIVWMNFKKQDDEKKKWPISIQLNRIGFVIQ